MARRLACRCSSWNTSERGFSASNSRVGHGRDADPAQVAAPVDDRGLAGHQHGLGDHPLGLGLRTVVTVALNTADSHRPFDAFAGVHRGPADVADHGLATPASASIPDSVRACADAMGIGAHE